MTDELLRALGKQQRRDPSPGSAMPPNSTDAEALLRPFDTEEREALLDRVMERLDRGPGLAEEPLPVVDLEARRRSPAVVLVAIAVSIAAVLLLWFVMRPPTPDVAGLPEYAFTQLQGGVAEQRSADALPEVVKVHADDSIDWVLTPAQPVRAAIDVGLLAEPDEGVARLVPLPAAQVSTSGAIRIEGRLADHVALEPGAWTLSIVVAPEGELPDDAARADRWRVASVRAIVIADR
jgi:hypothetical protein